MVKAKTNPELDKIMKETVVSRAVDDGDGVILQAPTNDVKGPYESEVDFQHWAQGDSQTQSTVGITSKLRLIRSEVQHGIETVQTSVKHGFETVQHNVKDGLVTAQEKVKANPYVYALAAVGVGFVIGRIFMSRRQSAAKISLSQFRDSPSQHTGVHVRRESRFVR